jgi:hypothetical protein
VEPTSGTAPSRRRRFSPASALDFQHEGANVRGEPEKLKVPLPEAAAWIETGLEHARRVRVSAGHFERDRLGRCRSLRLIRPATAAFAQVDGAQRQRAPQRGLERSTNQLNIQTTIERPGQGGEQIAEHVPAIALSWKMERHDLARTKRSAIIVRLAGVENAAELCEVRRHVRSPRG